MSLTAGMNLEAGATGRDISEVQRAPFAQRLKLAPIGLAMAEVGVQVGAFVEDQLADFFPERDKKGKKDKSSRAKVLLGKVFLSVLLYPVSAPLALGFAASGSVLHLLLGVTTLAEAKDQAVRRGLQLVKLGEKPTGRYTQKLKDKSDSNDDEDSDDRQSTDKNAKDEPAEADESDIDLAAKLTDPDVLSTYGKAADLAWERLIRDGHLPPGTKPVINEAMVQEVQNLVRDAQKRGGL